MGDGGIFENICHSSPLWNESLTWGGSWPQFTDCFQNTVLVWIPCGWLWVSSFFYILFLFKLDTLDYPLSFLNIFRMVSCSFIFILCVVKVLSAGYSFLSAEVAGSSIQAVTMVLSLTLQYLEQRKGCIRSGVHLIFWILLVLGNVVPLYSKIVLEEYKEDILRFVLFLIFVTLVFIVMTTYFLADQLPKNYHELNKKQCPVADASLLSHLTFWWMNNIIYQGFWKLLNETDVWELEYVDKTCYVFPKFQAAWESEILKSKLQLDDKRHKRSKRTSSSSENIFLNHETIPLLKISKKNVRKQKNVSLLKVMVMTFGPELLVAHLNKLVYDGLIFLNPLLLSALIEFVKEKTEDLWKGYVYALAFFVVNLLQCIFLQQLFHQSWRVGLRVKTAITAAVYEKILSIKNAAFEEAPTAGEILNLITVDAQHFQEMIPYLWVLWSGPLQIGLCFFMLYNLLGTSVLASLPVLLLMIPVVGVAAYQINLQEQQMKEKDNRMKLMTEILTGIKILKLCAWEIAFQKKISEIRKQEISKLRKATLLDVFGIFTGALTPYLVSLATFFTYLYLLDYSSLSSETAFVALSIFNILRYIFILMPVVISDIIKANVSLKRICNFLNYQHVNVKCVGCKPSSGCAVSVHNGTFAWSGRGEPILRNINLDIFSGSLIAIVGAVGSGKSSLIAAILGEMENIDGKVDIKGSKAFVPQEAWIQNATIKENIVFGREFNERYYDKVLNACALPIDLALLPAGDQTEIGEKGVNLSGGQKQRVSLARSAYSEADIYLFDDSLSAVDNCVGKHIFDQLLSNNGLLHGKTRILVTHSIQFLPLADMIVMMSHGRISEMGSYNDLMECNGHFSEFIQSYSLLKENEECQKKSTFGLLSYNSEEYFTASEAISSPVRHLLQRKFSRRRRLSLNISKAVSLEKYRDDNRRNQDMMDKLIDEERAEIGQVKWTVFATYSKFIGVGSCVLIFVWYALFEASSVGSIVWLSIWTEDSILTNRNLSGNSTYKQRNNFYIGIYSVFGFLQSIFIIVFSCFSVVKFLKAAEQFHSEMLINVLSSPVAFFNTTPVGRILNRFSNDIDAVDTELPALFSMWIDALFVVFATILVISYSSTPYILFVFFVLAIIYLILQRIYIPSSRQLQRLESKTRSKICSHFIETVTGANVIRAYGAQIWFLDEAFERIDRNQALFFAGITAKRWAGFRLQLLGSIIVFVVSLFVVIETDDGRMNGGLVGLGITFALEVTLSLDWLVRMTSDIETKSVSLERIKEYMEIPKEHTEKEDFVPSTWPQSGMIEFQNFSTRYRLGLNLVLKKINLKIHPGQKVGIVGRTGAGKSSLALSLFRIVSAAQGTIYIDGMDISKINLHTLRTRLAILPQDPILFSGTLRGNLDPFNNYSDEDIWMALARVNLHSHIRSFPETLQYECGEAGQNFSVGQKQLLSLARCLLQKSNILILDEATATVDVKTDHFIQQTIREQFASCTVITIAHRLESVMDYDRIFVLENGEGKEFNTPKNLLANKDSLFYKMAKNARII